MSLHNRIKNLESLFDERHVGEAFDPRPTVAAILSDPVAFELGREVRRLAELHPLDHPAVTAAWGELQARLAEVRGEPA